MTKISAALVAVLLLAGAAPQDPAGGEVDKKAEAQKKEEAAKAALKEYREARTKVKSEMDLTSAILILGDAEPHALIRKELFALIASELPSASRVEAAKALEDYKKDPIACDGLLQAVKQQKDKDVRRRCIRSFGKIAPFGKSVELTKLFPDQDTAVVQEALAAVESIKSVRVLKPVVDLLGDLERIREDDAQDPGGSGGVPQQGESKDARRQRKKDLLEPAKKAVNTLYSKVDSKANLKGATEAYKAMNDKKADLKKAQDEEDKQDKAP